MKCLLSFVCVMSVLVYISEAAPAPQTDTNQAPSSSAGGLAFLDQNTIQRILDAAQMKIAILRRLFPDLAKVVDNVIQNVTSQVFRVVGRALLQGGALGGGGSGSSGGNNTRRVSVSLPTFPPDFDDEDEDEDESVSESSNETKEPIISSSSSSTIISSSDATTTTATTDPERIVLSSFGSTEAVNNALFTSPADDAENILRKRHVRIVRATEDVKKNDQDTASSNAVPEPQEDLANFDDDDADRNKRFLPFGGGGDGHSGGGSGNFLFDIIRLVAGSGATEETDEKENSPGGVAEVDVAKGDGYTEGIPGPITRLLVIANRGLANLVQDLILRLAQTSERIVNFKARLITSLI